MHRWQRNSWSLRDKAQTVYAFSLDLFHFFTIYATSLTASLTTAAACFSFSFSFSQWTGHPQAWVNGAVYALYPSQLQPTDTVCAGERQVGSQLLVNDSREAPLVVDEERIRFEVKVGEECQLGVLRQVIRPGKESTEF